MKADELGSFFGENVLRRFAPLPQSKTIVITDDDVTQGWTHLHALAPSERVVLYGVHLTDARGESFILSEMHEQFSDYQYALQEITPWSIYWNRIMQDTCILILRADASGQVIVRGAHMAGGKSPFAQVYDDLLAKMNQEAAA